MLGLAAVVQRYALWGLNSFLASFPLFFCRRFRYFTCSGCGTWKLGTFFVFHRAYFSRSAKNKEFFAGMLVVHFFKERFGICRYPASRRISFTKPAKRSLPFLQAGQLGCRKFWIHSRISIHTVSCFSKIRIPCIDTNRS